MFDVSVGRGMTYLHNEPNVIIHRDLKPRSVFLSTWFCYMLHVAIHLGGSYCLMRMMLPFFFYDSISFSAECVNVSRNVLLVNSNADHLKVGDFGLSKLIRVQNSHDVYKMTGETGSCKWQFHISPWHILSNVLFIFDIFFYNRKIDRYMAPEVFKHRKYDKKVDVFSFAMILYEVIITFGLCLLGLGITWSMKQITGQRIFYWCRC